MLPPSSAAVVKQGLHRKSAKFRRFFSLLVDRLEALWLRIKTETTLEFKKKQIADLPEYENIIDIPKFP